MKKSKVVLIALGIIVMSLICCVWAKGPNPDVKKLRDGDIVFHCSDSRQAPLLRYATASPVTHCGIVIEKGDKLYVLEAENGVELTAIEKWIDRGIGGVYMVRRSKKPLNKKVSYKKYLGIRYDMSFKFDNGKYYCSELVWEIFRDQYGVTLCEPRPLKDYHTLGIEKEVKRRGMKIDQLMVAPVDLLDSDELEVIY